MKKIYLLFVLIVAGATLSAQTTFTSAQVGNWTTPATWTYTGDEPALQYPSAPTDIVVIGHDVTLDVASKIDVNDVTVNSGSLTIAGTSYLNAPNGFNSTTSTNLTINGYLFVTGTASSTLTLSSNIIGEGEVIASIYSYGANTIYGVSPADGIKVSGGTWTGGSSGWATAANWSQGVLPSATTNVDIPTGSPTVSTSGAAAKRISIQSGASLTVGVAGELTVNQWIDNNAGTTGIVIESDASGAGSLIYYVDQDPHPQYPGEPEGTVQRYLTDGNAHLVSTPTTGTKASNFFFDRSPIVWLSSHEESTNAWSFIIDTSTVIVVAKGYSVWLDVASRSDATAEFAGDLRSTDFVTPSGFLTNNGSGFGSNLVGNPFSSALSVAQNVGWSNTDCETTIWVWEQQGGESGNYIFKSYEGGSPSGTLEYIPMAQGFFVQADGDSPTLTIPATARVHNTGLFYKNAQETDVPNIEIETSSGQLKDIVWVSFGENGSPDYDKNWDIRKLRGGGDSPQSYLIENNVELSANHQENLVVGEERTVNLNFEAGIDDDYELSSTIENLDGVKITLEDLKTGVFHNLTKYPVYTFKGLTTDNPDRFRIHFKYLITDVDDPVADADDVISVYSFDNKVYIRNNEPLNTEMADVMIYDLFGRELYRSKITLGSMTEIPVSVNNNYLVVKVAQGNQAHTQKVFVK